ncbi:DUF115 domain-containing protein, partial [Patescibacteria group bacterium]|nr:DUF115 domain-containing protein [Patescibacteria group bacterium]
QNGLMMHRQIQRKVPDSLANIRKNMPRFLNCKSVNLIKEIEREIQASKAALIIANGPSLSDEQLELIKNSEFRTRGGLTLCVDSALRRVLRAGIIPDFVVLLDTAIYAKEFFQDEVFERYNKRLNYIVPFDMHPEVLAMLQGELYFFRPVWPPYPSINLTAYMNYMFPDMPEIDSGGNVGTFSMILAYHLGKEWVAVVGLDFSQPGHVKPWETENFFLDVLDHGGNIIYGPKGEYLGVQWPCGLERCPSPECVERRKVEPDHQECQEALDSQFVHVTDPFGNDRMIDAIYDMYVDLLAVRVSNMKELRKEQRFFNCTGAGLAYVDGMERVTLKEYFDLLGV